MMCFLIEEILPKDYFTSMISLTADINLARQYLRHKLPLLASHLDSLNFLLPMVFVELFLTCFTINRTECTDIIVDAVLLEGSTALFKAILVFFIDFEAEIIQMNDFGKVDLI